MIEQRVQPHWIPQVEVEQIVDLLTLLLETPATTSVFDINYELGQELGQTVTVVKAAEILEFVDTPKNDVILTPHGRQFIDSAERPALFRRQIASLPLFELLLEYLTHDGSVSEEIILAEIRYALPYDNPEKLLHTMIAWGSYAHILDYDRDRRKLFAN